MRLITGGVLLLLLVLFTLSNTQAVRLGLWPLDLALELPLSIAMLIGIGTAFFAGGLVVWMGGLGQRRRVRETEHLVRLLQAQIAERRPGPSSHPEA